MLRYLLSLVIVVVWGGISLSQTYTLKFKLEPDIGKTATIRSANQDSGGMKIFDEKGNQLNKDDDNKREASETVRFISILDRDPKESFASRYLVTYDKATKTLDNKVTPRSYQSRSIVYERKKDKTGLGVVGNFELEPKDQKDLLDGVNKSKNANRGELGVLKLLPPAKAVEVGESWKIDPVGFCEALNCDELEIAAQDSDVVCTLLMTYKKGEILYGIIQIKVSLRIRKVKFDQATIVFEKPGTQEHQIVYDGCIDGSAIDRVIIDRMSVRGSATLTSGKQKYRVEIEGGEVNRMETSLERLSTKVPDLAKVRMVWPGDWIVVNDKEESFTAAFPSAPKKSKKEEKEKNRNETRYTVNLEGGDIFFQVQSTRYLNLPAKPDYATMLENVEKSQKDAKEKKAIKLGDVPGLETLQEIDDKDGKIELRTRWFIVNERLYSVMVGYRATIAEKPDVKKFFDSFQFLKDAK